MEKLTVVRGAFLNNNYTLTIKTLPLPNDKINVEAHYNGVHHLKTYYPYDVNLENQLLQLFTDNARKKISTRCNARIVRHVVGFYTTG